MKNQAEILLLTTRLALFVPSSLTMRCRTSVSEGIPSLGQTISNMIA
ncbi:hypothetical protein LINGRAHAP2_LOCUS10997 [Linum grandiflorum]